MIAAAVADTTAHLAVSIGVVASVQLRIALFALDSFAALPVVPLPTECLTGLGAQSGRARL